MRPRTIKGGVDYSSEIAKFKMRTPDLGEMHWRGKFRYKLRYYSDQWNSR